MGFFTTTQAQWQSNSSTIYSNTENIGIGTASPQSKLHVATNAPVIRLQNTAYEDTDNAFYGWLGGYDKSGDEIWWLGEGSSSGRSIGFHTNRPGYNLDIFNKGKGLTVDGSGNIGIGITNPKEKLQVNGGLQLGDNSAYKNVKFQMGTILSGYNATFEILPVTMPGSGVARQATYFKSAFHSTGGTQHDVIVDGNIGVGTLNPTSRLHIHSTSSGSSATGLLLTRDGGGALYAISGNRW